VDGVSADFGMTAKPFRKVRCKTSFGITVSWNIHQSEDGKWRLAGVGSARRGSSTVPSEFLPFEISNAVMSPLKPEFDSFEDAANYARTI
jgi:hypothetical protein